MKDYQLLYQWIQEAEEIALICHRTPDGDTVGCALALFAALTKAGKNVTVCCDDPLPKDLSALPNADIFAVQRDKKDYDLALAVDVADPFLAGEAGKLLATSKHSACIDHHGTHTKTAELDVVHECAANTQNVFNFLAQFFPETLDLDVATCIYTGLVTDSGGFTYSSVTPETHFIAGKCLALGVDGEKICYEQLKRISLAYLRVRSESYSKALYEFGGKVGVVTFSADLMAKYGVTQEDLAGSLVEMMRADSIQIGIALSEVAPRSYKISLRSKGEISVADVARSFGGGGHRNAAGCRLNGDEGIVIDMLLEACAKQL